MASRQIILVIGAAGFIGRHTVARLVAGGHIVYATHLPAEAPPVIPDVNWLPCDLTAPEAMATWPERCNSLIYLAQSPAWRVFPDGAASVFQINVATAFRAAEYARQAGAQRFIFTSTGTVYTQTEHPARENEPFNLCLSQNFYVASKLAVELLLKPYANLFAPVILRLFVPYGLGQDPKMLIPQLIQRVREGRPIDLDGTDGLLINPMAVGDVAETIDRCLALTQSTILNVAGPEVLTLRKIGTCIGHVLGLMPHFEVKPDSTPPVIVGDTSLCKEVLGWTPETPFETGLRAWLTPAT